MAILTCPMCNCARETKCSDSRTRDVGGFSVISRRRECTACGHLWRTSEVPTEALRRAVDLSAAATKLFNLSAEHAEALREVADAVGDVVKGGTPDG